MDSRKNVNVHIFFTFFRKITYTLLYSIKKHTTKQQAFVFGGVQSNQKRWYHLLINVNKNLILKI